MAEKTENNAEDEQKKKGMELLNQISRSAIAVIDTVTQRGGFKGEELTTIGGLRDQCVQIIQLSEQIQQEDAMTDNSTQTETKPKTIK